MNITKIAVLPVILLAFLTLEGCMTVVPETTITGFQKVSSFENKKVHLSLPVVVEKDMETKKTPDAMEKVVADELYTKLKEGLNQKGLLAGDKSASLNLDLRVHYVSRAFAEWEYFGSRILADRTMGGQILVTKGILKNMTGGEIAEIDTIDNTGIVYSYQRLTGRISVELANQIEKILKEGVSVGKSP